MKMKLCKSVVALAASLLSLAASAQKEQWLEYHTSTEPKGYRWLDLSTTAPANVALPAGLKPGAWFGRWKNGMEAGDGRVFCLDSTSKSKLCDRIFFDSNGNGQLNDETPVKLTRRDSNMAYFEPIKIVFKGEDGPITYHLIARFYSFEKRAQLLVGAGCWYEGSVNLAGKQRRLQLIDSTANGVFNDLTENPYDCDRIVLQGDKGMDRYLGRYLEVDGQLLKIEVARDGAFIKAQKAEGVEFGTIKVPETISEFTAFGQNGHFVRQPKNGEFTLPAGKYRVHGWNIDRKDDKGVAWKLTGSGSSDTAAFVVTATNSVSLDVGEPVKTTLTFRETKTGGSFDLKFKGNLGETIEIMRGTERARAPQLRFASADGSFRATNTFEYG